MSPRLLPCFATVLLAAMPLYAQQPVPPTGRAMWFWQSPKSPFGSANILGDSAREDAAIVRLKAWGINTLYGSYPSSVSPATLRAWNAKLTRNSITSLLLLSQTEYLDPTTYPELDARIADAYTSFNAKAAPEERFAGLAFDIEPHIAPTWKSAPTLARRQELDRLLHLYQHVRTLIPASTQLEATLPNWYSHLNGSIAWSNALDRNRWFAALAQACDRISIMSFEQPSGAKALARASEEVMLLKDHARIALRANLGNEWPNLASFWQATRDVEQAMHQGIEIQDFAILAGNESR